MVVLFVAHDVDGLVDLKILVFQVCRTHVLGDVDGGAIATQYQLFVQPFVAQIHPNGAIFFFEEDAFGQAFFHDVLAE